MTVQKVAKMGLYLLKESVYSVLDESDEPLRAKNIREHLGIENVPAPQGKRNRLIYGVLHHLKSEKRVKDIPDGKDKYKWTVVE